MSRRFKKMAKRHHRKLKAADKTQIHWVGKLKTEFLEPTNNQYIFNFIGLRRFPESFFSVFIRPMYHN